MVFLRHLVSWPSIDIQVKFYEDGLRGTLPSRGLNARGVAGCSDFGHREGYISETERSHTIFGGQGFRFAVLRLTLIIDQYKLNPQQNVFHVNYKPFRRDLIRYFHTARNCNTKIILTNPTLVQLASAAPPSFLSLLLLLLLLLVFVYDDYNAEHQLFFA